MWSLIDPTTQTTVSQVRQKPQKVVYKYVKPSQPIYRPPSARIAFNRNESPESQSESTTLLMHTNYDNFQPLRRPHPLGNTLKISESPINSPLRRSKSFCAKEMNNHDSMGHLMSIEDISWENVVLVREAIEKTDSMSTNQLMQIVRIICNKALEKSCYCHSLAILCLTIDKKQCKPRPHLFIESLVNCLREWFNERDKLRLTTGGARRWTAYVTFLSELYLNLRKGVNHRNNTIESYYDNTNDEVIESDEQESDQSEDKQQISETLSVSLKVKQQKHLYLLLYDSLQTILLNPNSTPTEIECLQSVLRSCGKYLEEDNACRMKSLISFIRDTFLADPHSNNHHMNCQKLYLEIIELASSRWHFNADQQIYYFPYTKSDH
ncbi:uncharacterized protein LOC128952146 [Oppia nitens]|uniref:uncharacterized protein LOC128952146 n=1 Tax=Oppia nitens TaxID=1686743 RepID=UPI0023DAD622|nr:uncharacterized protein LOC128952146 [Oppia nitens]